MMHRRTFISDACRAAVAAGTLTPLLPVFGDEPPRPSGLGLVSYSQRIRAEAVKRQSPGVDLFEPLTFLEHCRTLGAGGMQLSLGVLDDERAGQLRRQADAAGLYIEAIISLPASTADLDRFDAQMRSAAAAGAKAVRTTMLSGRRYEEFDSLEAFREQEVRGVRSLERAAPIAERHQLPLAVENHKDQRSDQRVALLRRISNQYVGACVDTGNSMALLEDPLETVQQLAPWARSVHLKDQAVQPYADGFLLGDIPLGQGCLDLKQIVATLRQHHPEIRFSLELITRDPLKVPCLTDRYWATFPDVPGRELARMLRMVQAQAAVEMQQVSSRAPDDQLALEDQNVRASLDFARDQLSL